MSQSLHAKTQTFIAPEVCDDPDAALSWVQAIYAQSLSHLRRYVAGETLTDKIRACYPLVRLQTSTDWMPPPHHEEEWLSFGFVATAGRYETTLTRPDLFAVYLRQQFEWVRQCSKECHVSDFSQSSVSTRIRCVSHSELVRSFGLDGGHLFCPS